MWLWEALTKKKQENHELESYILPIKDVKTFKEKYPQVIFASNEELSEEESLAIGYEIHITSKQASEISKQYRLIKAAKNFFSLSLHEEKCNKCRA